MSLTLSRRVPVVALSSTSVDTVRGIAIITVCYFIMTFADVATKFSLPMAGLAGAILFRGGLGAATVLALSARDGRAGLRRLVPVRRGMVLMRGIVQAMVGVTWFASWQSMTLADSYAVGFTTPLVATLLAVLLIGERLDGKRILATVLGFAGVLIMLRPGGDLWSPALVLLLAGVVCSAVARIMTRQLSTTETPECLAFSLLLMHVPVGLLMLPFLPIPGLTGQALMALAALGLLSGIAQMMNARAYALAPVSALAPFDYSSMLWALALGWICFGEVPHLAAVQGAIVIAAAGLYSFHCERNRSRQERRRVFIANSNG
jgi:drug/metabolite transporter (DMT)-like permease